MSWVLDSGSAAIIVMGAFIILVRARYFCRYGKEALLVAAVHIVGVGLIRLAGTHDIVIFKAGVVNSYWSIACLGVQVPTMFQAEWTLRHERAREAICH